jgi:hypothetical protein
MWFANYIFRPRSDLVFSAEYRRLRTINLIGATRTRSELRVKALLDTARYETGVKVSGVKVSDEQIDKQRIHRSQFHPEWNYTILPRSA